MKFKRIFIFCLFWLLFAAHANASVIDAPHNADSNVSCSSCHSYSLWWQYSSLGGAESFLQVSDFDSATTLVCLSCHGDPAETIAPHKNAAHSSAALGQAYGTWEVVCVECHDPHFQPQLEWAGLVPTEALFLATGLIGAESGIVNNGNGTTSLGYTLISSNSGWDVTAALNPNNNDWARKNDNPTRDRGLILVVDNDPASLTFAKSTYKIISADGSQITVQGGLDAARKTDAAGSPFGLIYGQMIKKDILAPTVSSPGIYASREVKFFDPQIVYSHPTKTFGGFVDSSSPDRMGICQVCHVATDYWTEDGANDGAHNPDRACTECHQRLSGFRQLTDHSLFLIKTGNFCEGCHDRLGTADVQTGIHPDCTNCHGADKSLILGARGWGDASLHGLGTTSDCLKCHPGYDANFQSAHQAPTHSNLIPAVGCSPCHTGDHSGDLLVDIHGSGSTADCLKCHVDMTVGSLLGSASNGPGDCLQCHLAKDINDHQAGHDATGYDSTPLNIGKTCFECHADKININSGHVGNLDSGGQPIGCSTCHAPAYQAFIDQGRAGTTVYCLDCHGERAAEHPLIPDHEATGKVTVTASCVSCHDPGNNKDMIADIHVGNCNSCHSTEVFSRLIGGAAGREGLTSSCADCHSLRASDYTQHSAPTHAALTITVGCDAASCHPGPGLIVDVHQDNCAGCHTSTTGVLIGSASAGASTCSGCHVSRDVNAHLAEHAAVVFDSAPLLPCAGCHAVMLNSSSDHLGKLIKRGTINGPGGIGTAVNCASCHSSVAQNVLAAIAAGKGGATIDCEDCHGLQSDTHDADVTPDHRSVGYVTATASCAECHDPGGSKDVLVDIHNNVCSHCHVLSNFTVLVGSALGREGAVPNECIACHTSYYPDYNYSTAHKVKDHDGVTVTAKCQQCHSDSDIINGTHDVTSQGNGYSCGLCHEPLTGRLISGIYGDATGHSLDTPSGCADCHASYDQDFLSHTSPAHATLTVTSGCESCHLEATSPFIGSTSSRGHDS